MANGWYDVDTGSQWVPFVGGGIGAALVNLDVQSIAGVATPFDETDTVFAYQFGAGLGYKVTPNAIVNVSYRLFGTTDPEFSDGVDTVEAEYLNHSFMVGVVVQF
jgi:OOP family OmpA-OmpF porin